MFSFALTKAVQDLKTEIADLKIERGKWRVAASLEADIVSLKQQISDLEIKRDKKREDFERRERELTHMIGLEKKRQEFEIAQAKRETSASVREENLKADKQRFEQQMKFHEDRFTKEIGYLKELLEQIMGRLPTVTVDRQVTERRG